MTFALNVARKPHESGTCATYAEGVGKCEPMVASTLGSGHNQTLHSERVSLQIEHFQCFCRWFVYVPGLKQPWAGICQRLRRTCTHQTATLPLPKNSRLLNLHHAQRVRSSTA